MRKGTILHVALQVVDDAKTLLTPFLPESSGKVHQMFGGEGEWTSMPEIQQVTEDGGDPYTVITGDYTRDAAQWEHRPLRPGTPLAKPKPLFAKLDASIVEAELARLEEV